MKAFGANLNAGLKDSATWALKAATDLKRATITAVSGSTSVQDLASIDQHLEGAPEEHLVVEICSADGLPTQTSFVALAVADNTGLLRGRRVTTLPRTYTNQPVWNSPRDLAAEPRPGDLLLVEVYSTDFNKLVCSGHIALELLPDNEAPVTLRLRRQLDIRLQGAGTAQGAGTFTLRRLKWKGAEHKCMKLFLVRHGQSRWNEAQKNRRLEKMVAFDHPLTRQGAEEAERLNKMWCAARMSANGSTVLPDVSSRPDFASRVGNASAQSIASSAPGPAPAAPAGDLLSFDDPAPPAPPAAAAAAAPAPQAISTPAPDGATDVWLHAFLNASVVASSPLTRAVQTAIVGLHMHPTVVEKGITLLRSAREIKGVGSLDTVGKAVGRHIKARAEETLKEEFEDNPRRVEKYMEVDLNFNDTISEWWTGTEAVDSDADVEERLTDLFAFLQFNGGEAAVLVGHSLLFREIMKRFTAEECRERKPELSTKLSEGKLQNAGCLGLDLEFDALGRVKIVDMELMFDSQVVTGH